jgi:hypothetical protein
MSTIIYVMFIKTYRFITTQGSPRPTVTVHWGDPSRHVVIKTKHRTATPHPSTECIQFKRNERLYSKLQPKMDPENDNLKMTKNQANYQSQNRTKVEQPIPTP